MLSHPNSAVSSPRLPLIKQLVVLCVLAIALAGAIPGYLGGKWAWQHTPKLDHLAQLKVVQQEGLTLPGWRTLEQTTVEIGGHRWSAQSMVPASSPANETKSQKAIWLLLRPQTWERDLPQIDWTDINGVQQWTTDSHQQIRFTAAAGQSGSSQVSPASEDASEVTARFFRGWTEQGTSAVLQWYAWSNGGHPAPSHWFWADQGQQFRHRQRLEWVAVSIQMPINPLDDLEVAQPDAEALGQLVQSTLMTTVFQVAQNPAS